MWLSVVFRLATWVAAVGDGARELMGWRGSSGVRGRAERLGSGRAGHSSVCAFRMGYGGAAAAASGDKVSGRSEVRGG